MHNALAPVFALASRRTIASSATRGNALTAPSPHENASKGIEGSHRSMRKPQP
jgi:hypothetical protein